MSDAEGREAAEAQIIDADDAPIAPRWSRSPWATVRSATSPSPARRQPTDGDQLRPQQRLGDRHRHVPGRRDRRQHRRTVRYRRRRWRRQPRLRQHRVACLRLDRRDRHGHATRSFTTHPLALSVSDLAASPTEQFTPAAMAPGADVAVLDTATGRVEAIDLGDRAGYHDRMRAHQPRRTSRLRRRQRARTAGGLSSLTTDAQSNDGRLRVVGTIEHRFAHPRCRAQPRRRAPPTWPAATPTWVRWSTSSIPGPTKSPAPASSATSVGILTGLTLSADGDRAYLVSDDRVTVLCTLTHDVIDTQGGDPAVVRGGKPGRQRTSTSRTIPVRSS